MGKHILVIDDEKMITRSLQIFLKKQGYEVTVAQSGAVALEKIQEADFDLIICDIRMPEMDGIEIIGEIRDYQKSKGKSLAPEIIITGYADEEKYKSAVNLKVAEYIYKPFDTKEFLEAVKRQLCPR